MTTTEITETHEPTDDGERRCEECGESFNIEETGEQDVCLKCEPEPETTTTPTVGGFIEADLLRAACEVAANPRDEHRVALTCVALTIEGDRFQVQATDSYSAFWTGDAPSDAGHYLVDAADLAKALRANRAKGLLALSIVGDEIEVATVTLPEVKRFTLPLCPAAFPRLARCLPTGDPQELTSILLSNITMAKVVAVVKALDAEHYGLTFRGPAKPVMVDLANRPEAHMLVMPVQR